MKKGQDVPVKEGSKNEVEQKRLMTYYNRMRNEEKRLDLVDDEDKDVNCVWQKSKSLKANCNGLVNVSWRAGFN